MEQNKTRVLAYHLATELDSEMLDDVSGGQGADKNLMTVRLTGDSARGGDAGADYLF